MHQRIGQPFRNDRSAAVIDDEAFAQEPADGDAVLEQRVHPGIRMRVVRRRRAVDGVAAGVRRHGHHRHAVGEPAVDGLQVLVVERLLPHDGGHGADEVLVRDRTVRGHARLGVLLVLAAQAHEQVGDRLAEERRTPPGSAALSAASFATPSRSSSSALARKRSAFAWKIGRMYASVTDVMALRMLFSPQPAHAPSPETSAS